MEKSLGLGKFFSLGYHYQVLRGEAGPAMVPEPLRKVLAVVVVSMDRFIRDASGISASALTFYSIFAVIPGFALMLALARGFGADEILQEWLKGQNYTNPEVMDWVMDFASRALDNARNGWIAGLGIVLLLWSGIRMLAGTELAMNRILQVRRGRTVARQFIDYTSISFMLPVLVLLICSINVFLMSNLQEYETGEGLLVFAGAALRNILPFLPYLLVWLLFLFIYMFIPTTPVKFRHALLSAVIAGSVFQLVQWFYLRFQIGVSSYNAIYGGLAALPLLMVWLQLSWSIVLWGTELCYVMKYRHFMYPCSSDTTYQWVNRVDLAIRILKTVSGNYRAGSGACSLAGICKDTEESPGKVRIVLQELVSVGFLEELKSEDDLCYLPLKDLHSLSVSDVILRFSQVDGSSGDDWKRRFAADVRKEFSRDTFA